MFLILNATLNCLSWKCLIMQCGCNLGMHHREGQRQNNWLGKASQLNPTKSTLASNGNTEVGDWRKQSEEDKKNQRMSHKEKELQFFSLLSPLQKVMWYIYSRCLYYPGVQTTTKDMFSAIELGKRMGYRTWMMLLTEAQEICPKTSAP